MIFGHPKCPPVAILWKWKIIKKIKVDYWSEMAKNAIESDFRSSKMASRHPFCEEKKVAYWSEMLRNAIKSDFRSSKMPLGKYTNSSFILIYVC